MAFTIDIWTVLVVLVIILFLIPIVQQRAIQKKRLQVMRNLEVKRGSRVIALIHRQETMSLLGIPIIRYIDINDSEEILRAIRFTPEQMPIDFIIHTPGGLVLSSEQIAMALQRHSGIVTVFVPHYAMSGGTLLCLAAREVIMDENAVLGPVDPQLGDFPASSILRVIQQKSPADIDDKTFILSDIAEKAQTQMKDFIIRLLKGRMDEAKAERIALTLTEGRWTHDYPITSDQAKEMGLPVSTEVPPEIYQLMDLFPQAMARRPSVEYIPVPYQKEREGKRGEK
jgi:ClpP class serine protease